MTFICRKKPNRILDSLEFGSFTDKTVINFTLPTFRLHNTLFCFVRHKTVKNGHRCLKEPLIITPIVVFVYFGVGWGHFGAFHRVCRVNTGS